MNCVHLLSFFLIPIFLYGDPAKNFNELISEGFGGVRFGNSADLGDYILSVSISEFPASTDPMLAIETARIIAQRDLAGILGTKMSSRTEIKTSSTTISVEEETKTEIKEFFSDFIQTDINQYLRGATVFDSRIIENKIYVGFLLSKKYAQDAAELAAFADTGPANAVSFNGGGEKKRDLRVEAVGLAAVRNGQIQTAREDAMASARRNAVEHAMGVTVVATGQVKNLDPNSASFKNFSMSLGEVLRSKVLAEGQEGVFYKIKIAALVTSADFSRELGKYMTAIGNPLFYVDRSSGDELGDEFSVFFKDIGFKITTNPREADYFIRLRSKFLDRKHPLRGTTGTQLQITLEIIDPFNEKVLLVERNNPRASTNFLSDPDRRRQLVSEKALLSMENSLREKVGKMIADMVQNGREIEVSFRGGDKLGQPLLDYVSDQLEWIPGTSNPQGSVSFGTLDFKLRYLGSMDLLRSSLQSEIQKNFTTNSISLNVQQPNRIEYLVR
jgi:hypothetical protein